MKYLIFWMLTLFFILCMEHTYAQANQDSLWARSVRTMKKQLQLSDATTLGLLKSGQEQLRQTALLNAKKGLSPEERGKVLKQIQQQFHQRVQSILTPEQWRGYKELEEAMRNKFINDAKSKNKPYKELGS